MSRSGAQRLTLYTGLGAGLGLLVGLLAPVPHVAAPIQHALGIALFAALAWTGRPVPLEFSSLVVLLALPATGLLSFAETFEAFTGPAVWLVFAGMVLSHMLLDLEMGQTLADRMVGFLAGGRLRLLLSLHALGLASAFLVPSAVVRVLLLLPLAEAVAARLGNGDDRRLRATVVLSLVCSTYFGGGGVLTGGVPNLVVVGQYQASTGITVYWSEWLAWMFPVNGLARTGLCAVVIWFLQARHLPASWDRPAPRAAREPDRRQWAAAAILTVGVLMWATDAVHHVPPVYVGLVLALLCIAPRWGPLPASSLRDLNFPFLLYLAALFAIGDAVQASGLGERFVSAGTASVGLGDAPLWARYLAVTAVTLPLDFLMDIAAVAGVTTPVIVDLASGHGMQAMTAAMAVAMATTVVFLPYQSAPFMVPLEQRCIGLRDLVAAMTAISALSVLLVTPLNLLYWSRMGWL